MPDAGGGEVRRDVDSGGSNSARLRLRHVPDRGIGTAGTILFRWALTPEERAELEAEGFRSVAVHPLFGGRSVLMRREES